MKSETSQTDKSCGNDAMINCNDYRYGSWHNTGPDTRNPYGNSPMNEYAHFPNYISHGVPPEPLSCIPTSLAHQQIAHVGHMAHQHLSMLTTTATWPCELTTHTPSNDCSSSSNMLAPASMSAMCGAKPPEKTRKILTFEQKRDMCLYHKKKPRMRQADVGDIFKVERRYAFHAKTASFQYVTCWT